MAGMGVSFLGFSATIGLSQHLPHFVDQLTPDARLPNEAEAARMV